MAKKKEKGKKGKESSNPADALRDAVERTFAGAAGVPAGAQKRAQELFDEVTTALTRLRDAVEERRVLETLEQLRDQVEGLARRVAALERGGEGGQAAPARARSSAKGAGTQVKRSTSPRSTSGTTRSRSTTARPRTGSSGTGSSGTGSSGTGSGTSRAASSGGRPGTGRSTSSRSTRSGSTSARSSSTRSSSTRPKPAASSGGTPASPPASGAPSTSADGTTDGSGSSGSASS